MGDSPKKWSNLALPGFLCLTLGLAPFFPEPHIVKQLSSLAQGTFTKPLDWFDLVMHGSPWVYFGFTLFKLIKTQG